MFMSEAQIRAMKIPNEARFARTDTFQPLSHGEALDAVEEAIEKAGLSIRRDDLGNLEKGFTTVHDGAKMFGTLPLTQRIDDESCLMLGIANSYNKTMALRIGFGARVFVCTNGSFFAEKVIGRKHTANILKDLPGLISQALAQTHTYIEQQGKFFQRLRDIEMTDAQVHDFVVRAAVEHEAITGGEIEDVVNEWRMPRFPEFKPRNAWSLHNAFTEVGKRIQVKNGNLHGERMVALSGFFADTFAPDLALAATRKGDLAQLSVN